MQSRTRAVMLGLLAVMLVGSVMAATATAGPGPFWYHREVGGKGNGTKIAANSPESFRGTGGEQTLTSTFGTETVELRSRSVQVKGAIANGPLQGQIKLEIIYSQPEVLKPTGKPCEVVIGEKNIVVVKGHLMWKWNGEVKQLEEQKQETQVPDLVFTPAELLQGAKELPKGEFTKLNFKGGGCGPLVGPQKVGGSEVGLPTPGTVGVFSTTLGVRTIPSGTVPHLWQHFWNGFEFVGIKAGLEFASVAANLVGQTEAKAEQQEVGVLES
jgi:hypothetical protein